MFRPNLKSGIIFSFICLLLLGMMPVISNSRPPSLNALNFALFLSLWQLLFSLPLFLGELRFKRYGVFASQLPPALKRRVITIIIVTGFFFGLSTYLYVLSVEKAGTVSAAIAMQSYPMFAILWETLFLGRRKNRVELLFTVLLIVTLYYLATSGSWEIDGISPWFLVALCVPFLWSIAHVIIKEMIDKTPISPAQITFFRVLVSSVALLIISVINNGWHSVTEALFNYEYQQFALVMGLVYYIELVVWFYAVKNIDVSIASSVTTPWPVVTMVFAAIFLKESIEGYQVYAALLVAFCIFGLIYAARAKNRTET